MVGNNPIGITWLLDWVAWQGIAPSQVQAVMEATDIYHDVSVHALFEAGVTVSILNPVQAKDVARGLAVRIKTAGVDGHILARFDALLKPPAGQLYPAFAQSSPLAEESAEETKALNNKLRSARLDSNLTLVR